MPVRTKRTPKGWVSFNCPMCSDTRHRGGVLVTGPSISYHCFNCGFKTRWAPSPWIPKRYRELAERMGATAHEVHLAQMELLKHAEDIQDIQDDEYVYSYQKFSQVQLPPGTQLVTDLPDHHAVKQYATQRGILDRTPLLYMEHEPQWRKRMVIPFVYNNQLVGWSGRHVNPASKQTPKYLDQLPASGFVYNVDRFADTDRDIMIVTEGLIDAILLDCAAIMGNEVSAEQAELIRRLDVRVILAPDRDQAGRQLIEQACDLGWEVSFPPWHPDCKDAADACARYGVLATTQSIITHATANKTKIQVKSRLL